MNPNDDPETLERRGDSLRADVGETLDALQRNYSPGALVDRSMDLLRNHGGQMATTIMDTVRRNPMPVLLVGAGVAWMIAAQLRSSSDEDDEEVTTYTTGSFASSDELEVAEDSDEADSTSGNGVGARLSNAKEKLQSAARERTRRAGAGMTRLLQEQPFAVGAAGVAIGALLGALLPESAQEDRLLGPVRDRALGKVREAGEQGFEASRQKVHEAVDRTTESIRDGGGREEGERGGATTQQS